MKKLILFDIDGTLLRHFGAEPNVNIGWNRFIYALKQVFHIDVTPDPKTNYHGSVDRAILFDIAGKYGITKKKFDEKFKEVKQEIIQYAHLRETKQIYEAIPDAVLLLQLLRNNPDRFILGILTGNVEKMAYWKLRHIGIDPSWFTLFVTSDEFEDRISLAKSLFSKAEKDANISVAPKDVVIIGDAIGDIECANAIDALCVVVTTGKHNRNELRAKHPTILVDSLMDPAVRDFFGV